MCVRAESGNRLHFTLKTQDITATADQGTRTNQTFQTCHSHRVNITLPFSPHTDYKKTIEHVDIVSTFFLGAKCFSIPITNDKLREEDEQFEIVLTSENPAVKIGSPAKAVVTILDDDGMFGVFFEKYKRYRVH